MSRILTGIQSTGVPHLGNILGAMLPSIKLSQDPKHEAYLFIADLHSLTQVKDAAAMRENTYAVAAAWLAFGFDTDKNVFYRQSDVTEVCELTWHLSCFTPYPMLANAHSFKDKQDRLAEVNAGVFTYPVLMAADIILYDANFVPVGKDQQQHLEITRDIASAFNRACGETFVVPEAMINEQVMIIPGTDGQKMSKSYNNTLNIFLPENDLNNVIAKIKTGSNPMNEPKDPDTCNVFRIFSLIADTDKVNAMRESYINPYADYRDRKILNHPGSPDVGYGYGNAKRELYSTILEKFKKERELYSYYMSDKNELEKMLKIGAEKAREVAQAKIKLVRERLGYKI